MDYQKLIDQFYPQDDALRRLLIRHSRQVADRALLICSRHPELRLDRQFLEEAAMLHDIGIVRCNAPGIHCHGTEPYICHGVIGAEMLRTAGWERHARVCERHTGAGISVADVRRQQLPLPLPPAEAALTEPYLPEALEEQVICYADKFYSKSHPDRVLTVTEAARSLEKFSADGVRRFLNWAAQFE